MTIAVSVALALGAIEVLLRLGPAGSNQIELGDLVQGYFSRLYDYDAHLGWVPKPYAETTKWGVEVHTGPEGLRLNAGPIPPENTHGQILAVGDSFTFGDAVGDADTWPAQLEGLLRGQQDAAPRVLNAGVSSYGLDQSVLRAEGLVPKFQPRVLIVGFTTDDIFRAAEYVRHGVFKPYFTLNNGALELQNAPPPRPDAPGPTRSFLLQHSALVGLLARSPLGAFWIAGTMGDVRADDTVSPDDIAARLIARLLALKKNYGFRLILMAQPAAASDRITESGIALLNAVAATDDDTVAAVDAFDALLAHSSTSEADALLFNDPVVGHMSPAGNRLIAATLLPTVMRLLP